MASSILHIKDSYYFEVPKFLWRSDRQEMESFEDVWVRLDPDFQQWEAQRLYESYRQLRPDAASAGELLEAYAEWKHHDHANAGRPFSSYLEQEAAKDWYAARRDEPDFAKKWQEAKVKASSLSEYRQEYRDGKVGKWSPEKIAAYNRHLDGKILIPQPFGELRNLYEPASGFCISKYMVVELFVGLLLLVLLSWLGRRVVTGSAPKGRLWNLLELFAVFVRDQIARPAIDHHHEEEGESAGGHGHGAPGHEAHGHHEAHGVAASSKSEHGAKHGHAHAHAHAAHDGDRYVPLLCTIFFFVLFCNLMGMIPWVGAPTSAWGATFGLALVTFLTVWLSGVKQFGLKGLFFLNHVPNMDLPLVMALLIKPTLYLIELLGLLIKHAVLSIRLLANMVAGHVVLLGIMGIAFSLEGAASNWWSVSAVISVVGSTLLSVLELAVAFIQAYIFTFLSALFIGSAVHEH